MTGSFYTIYSCWHGHWNAFTILFPTSRDAYNFVDRMTWESNDYRWIQIFDCNYVQIMNRRVYPLE